MFDNEKSLNLFLDFELRASQRVRLRIKVIRGGVCVNLKKKSILRGGRQMES